MQRRRPSVTEEAVLHQLESESRRRTEAVRALLAEEGRPDLVAELTGNWISHLPVGQLRWKSARRGHRLQVPCADVVDQQLDRQRPGRSNTVQIHQAVTAADLASVHRIMVAAWVPVPATAPSRLLLPPTLSTRYLLAHLGSEAAASVRLHSGDDALHLEKLSVSPKFRGSGLARRLFDAAVAIARACGFPAVTAEVYARHQWAWRRWGAQVAGAPGWIDGVPTVPWRFDIPDCPIGRI